MRWRQNCCSICWLDNFKACNILSKRFFGPRLINRRNTNRNIFSVCYCLLNQKVFTSSLLHESRRYVHIESSRKLPNKPASRSPNTEILVNAIITRKLGLKFCCLHVVIFVCFISFIHSNLLPTIRMFQSQKNWFSSCPRFILTMNWTRHACQTKCGQDPSWLFDDERGSVCSVSQILLYAFDRTTTIVAWTRQLYPPFMD